MIIFIILQMHMMHTFDLMFRSFTIDCYADGTPINKKAKLIRSHIKSHFKTLSNTGRYYWDRFI